MKHLKDLERRLHNLLEETKENLDAQENWGRTYDLGFIDALEQIQRIINEYKH